MMRPRTRHHPTRTSRVVMSFAFHRCWLRLQSNVGKPRRNSSCLYKQRRNITHLVEPGCNSCYFGDYCSHRLPHSLPASGSSRNQIESHEMRSPPLAACRRGAVVMMRPLTGHHPTRTCDVVMHAHGYSCWYRLRSHVDEPHGNHQTVTLTVPCSTALPSLRSPRPLASACTIGHDQAAFQLLGDDAWSTVR